MHRHAPPRRGGGSPVSRPWGHPQPSTKHRTGSSGPWQPLPGGVEGTGLTVPGATWPEASGGLGSTALSCNGMGEQLRDQGGGRSSLRRGPPLASASTVPCVPSRALTDWLTKSGRPGNQSWPACGPHATLPGNSPTGWHSSSLRHTPEEMGPGTLCTWPLPQATAPLSVQS